MVVVFLPGPLPGDILFVIVVCTVFLGFGDALFPLCERNSRKIKSQNIDGTLTHFLE